MNLRRIIVGGVLLLLLALLVIWLWPKESAPQLVTKTKLPAPSQQSDPTQSLSGPGRPGRQLAKEEVELIQKEKRREVIAQVDTMLNTPISFYGKVVDQNNVPVPGARVAYSLLDKFDASGSNARKRTDDAGYFEISGVKGAVLGVNVSKEGYYQIHNVSNQRFAYGTGPDGYTKKPPSKDNPAVFILQKMGETVPLVKVETGSIRVPKNGTPVNLSLATGKRGGNQILRVEAWTFNDGLDPNLNQPYDWRCRVSVPGGGLVERSDQFVFEAPQAGYREFDEVVFKKTDSTWRHRFNKEYFAKLPDGTHARFKFWFTTGGTHFFEVESYLNPNPGSRNLEFDSEKLVKP